MYRRYYHDEVGVNSRLDSVQAAVLRIKLRLLDEYAKARNEAAAYYDNAFANHPDILVRKSNRLYTRFPSVYIKNTKR